MSDIPTLERTTDLKPPSGKYKGQYSSYLLMVSSSG